MYDEKGGRINIFRGEYKNTPDQKCKKWIGNKILISELLTERPTKNGKWKRKASWR